MVPSRRQGNFAMVTRHGAAPKDDDDQDVSHRPTLSLKDAKIDLAALLRLHTRAHGMTTTDMPKCFLFNFASGMAAPFATLWLSHQTTAGPSSGTPIIRSLQTILAHFN